MDFNYSINGRNCDGRWYPRPDRVSIFLNVLSNGCNPENDLDGFIAKICAIEFHEIGHVYGFRGGCKPSKCKNGQCYWCKFVNTMFLWFKYNKRWFSYYSEYLRGDDNQ